MELSVLRKSFFANVLGVAAIFAVSGCASAGVDDSALESFSLAGFSSEWYDSSDRAGDGNFRAERVGDLCGFDYDIRTWGASPAGNPQLFIRDGNLSEQTVFAATYKANQGERLDELFEKLSSELARCSLGDFFNSTDDGILISESITNDVQQIDNPENFIGAATELVIMFDYVRVEKSSLINTNNDFTDDDEYESVGRVIVIGGKDSVLLVTSSGRSWENYGTAPSISEQNLVVSNRLTALLG